MVNIVIQRIAVQRNDELLRAGGGELHAEELRHEGRIDQGQDEAAQGKLGII